MACVGTYWAGIGIQGELLGYTRIYGVLGSQFGVQDTGASYLAHGFGVWGLKLLANSLCNL